MTETNFLTVVIKPTRNCNLRCRYCSVGDPKQRTLSFSEVGLIVEKIVTRKPQSMTKFIWHGGEPLLAGLDFYRHVVNIQRPLTRSGYSVINTIQTNGTLLDERWADFFKQHEFGVGLSIDGPESVNDLTRNFPGGKGAFSSIVKGSQILESHGLEHGFLVVISRQNVKHIDAIIDFMRLQKKRYKLVAVAPIGRAEKNKDSLMILGDDFSASQLRLFKRWLNENHPIDRDALWKYMVPVLTGHPVECIFLKNCQETFIGVDCNGDIYPCGRFCGSNNFLYGNLLQDSFEEVWNHPNRLTLYHRPEKLEKCHDCEFFKICNGGCPLQGVINGGIEQPDYNCQEYFRIFSEIKNTILKEAC